MQTGQHKKNMGGQCAVHVQALLKETDIEKEPGYYCVKIISLFFFFIRSLGSECVSVASIALYNTELCSMKSFV